MRRERGEEGLCLSQGKKRRGRRTFALDCRKGWNCFRLQRRGKDGPKKRILNFAKHRKVGKKLWSCCCGDISSLPRRELSLIWGSVSFEDGREGKRGLLSKEEKEASSNDRRKKFEVSVVREETFPPLKRRGREGRDYLLC